MEPVSSLKNNRAISPEAFARFMTRLSPDAERAGEEYEELRQMLVKYFECRGIAFADELADEAINRVIRQIGDGEEIQNLRGYCFSIARFVLKERSRSPENRQVDLAEMPSLAAPETKEDDEDARLECLQSCLNSLPVESRNLIIEYYQDERRVKIDGRQAIADRLGIRRNALTRRMVRLRTQLERCITRCVRKNTDFKQKKFGLQAAGLAAEPAA